MADLDGPTTSRASTMYAIFHIDAAGLSLDFGITSLIFRNPGDLIDLGSEPKQRVATPRDVCCFCTSESSLRGMGMPDENGRFILREIRALTESPPKGAPYPAVFAEMQQLWLREPAIPLTRHRRR